MVYGSAILLVLLTLAAALVLAAVGWWMFSTYVGAPGTSGPRIPCGFRGQSDVPWSTGSLQYSGELLVHKGPDAASSSSTHRWQRCELELGYAEALVDEAGAPGLPEGLSLAVSGRYGETTFDLAMTEEHYTALRSWLEAAPPGWNSNVA